MTLLGTAKKRLPPEKDVATWFKEAIEAESELVFDPDE
jgi:hypothetical protein